MLQVILAFNNSLLTLKTTWKLNVIYFSLFENHTLCLMQSLGTLLKLVLNPFWKCHTCKDASKQWESEDFSVCMEFFSLPFPSVNLAISESFFFFFLSYFTEMQCHACTRKMNQNIFCLCTVCVEIQGVTKEECNRY